MTSPFACDPLFKDALDYHARSVSCAAERPPAVCVANVAGMQHLAAGSNCNYGGRAAQSDRPGPPGFTPGQAYVTVGNDSPIFTSSLTTLDTTSGVITPVVTGFSSPKGLIFVE